MKRYSVFPDVSPGYVVFDELIETVVALYHNRGRAERVDDRRAYPRSPRDRERPLVTYDNYEPDARATALLFEVVKAVLLRERTYEIPTWAIAQAIANRDERERVRGARP